jgi:hypothetical protein
MGKSGDGPMEKWPSLMGEENVLSHREMSSLIGGENVQDAKCPDTLFLILFSTFQLFTNIAPILPCSDVDTPCRTYYSDTIVWP